MLHPGVGTEGAQFTPSAVRTGASMAQLRAEVLCRPGNLPPPPAPASPSGSQVQIRGGEG